MVYRIPTWLLLPFAALPVVWLLIMPRSVCGGEWHLYWITAIIGPLIGVAGLGGLLCSVRRRIDRAGLTALTVLYACPAMFSMYIILNTILTWTLAEPRTARVHANEVPCSSSTTHRSRPAHRRYAS